MAEASLLEVSLLVDGEMAEAVADVLGRFIPNGIVIESTQIAPDPDGEGHVTGPLKVCGYLPVNTQVETLRHKIQESLYYLGRIRRLPEPQFRYIAQTNWVEAWKEHYRPISIGQRLLIIPTWLTPPVGPRAAVRIDPGMAFGTGTHPTTQLCLEIIDRLYPEETKPDRFANGKPVRSPATVIDIGCGSGILSIAALKLGASYALAVDIDPLAIQASRENARLNGVEQRLELAAGSVQDIRSGKYSRMSASLVYANILAPVLVELFAQGLGDLIDTGGTGILSGILEEQTSDVESAAQAQGFQVVERRQSGDWVALAVSRLQ